MDTASDRAHCGACGVACASGDVCAAGRCVATRCAPACRAADGTLAAPADAACAACAPRLIAPLSTRVVATERPTLRWQASDATDGVRLEFARRADFMGGPTLIVEAQARGGLATAPALAPGAWFWRARARVGGVDGVEASPAWQLWIVRRTTPDARPGPARTDVDRDGLVDVVVGAPGFDAARGRIALFSGRPIEQFRRRPIVEDALLDAPLYEGVTAGSRFGNAVAAAGDMNGDGYGEIAVGAPGETLSGGEQLPPGVGEVWLIDAHGGRRARVVLPGETSTLFGFAIAAAGDLDADGYGDLVIGAPGRIPLQPQSACIGGSAYVLFGRADLYGAGVVLTPYRLSVEPFNTDDTSEVGSSVAGGSDLNDDGFDDVAIGVPGYEIGCSGNPPRPWGAVAVVLGGARTPFDRVWLPRPDGAHAFGRALVFTDWSGDGRVDLLVASDDSGGLWQFQGPLPADSWVPVPIANAPPSRVCRLAAGGDLDGDGVGEVALGAPMDSVGPTTGAGRAFVIRPMEGAAVTVRTIEGARGDTRLGASVSMAGDIDGDGFDDLAAGAPAANCMGASVGSDNDPVRIFFGGGAAPEIGLPLPRDNQRFGMSLAWLAPSATRRRR